VTPTRPYTGDIPETRTSSNIYAAFLPMNVLFMAVNDAAKLAGFKQRLGQYLWI